LNFAIDEQTSWNSDHRLFNGSISMASAQIVTFNLHGTGTGVAQSIRTEGSPHLIATDAHPAFGGQDTAPSPLAYVLAGLTSCTQVTAQVVARDLGIRLGRFDIALRADLDVAVLATGADGNGNFSSVNLQVSIETDATPEQFGRLQAETERRCPVSQLYRQSGIAISGAWTQRALDADRRAA
jgi:uncharacterized OsmC-like protein